MSLAARRWILLCLALLFTATATYLGCGAVGASLSDVFGPPQQRQEPRAALEHQAGTYTAKAVVCLILASLSLGTTFRRDNWKHSVAAYIGAFLVCPLISVLAIYILISLSP